MRSYCADACSTGFSAIFFSFAVHHPSCQNRFWLFILVAIMKLWHDESPFRNGLLRFGIVSLNEMLRSRMFLRLCSVVWDARRDYENGFNTQLEAYFQVS